MGNTIFDRIKSTFEEINGYINTKNIVEIQKSFLTLREEINGLWSENLDLKEKLLELQNENRKEEDLEMLENIDGLLWDTGRIHHENKAVDIKVGENKDGPFCIVCKEKDRKKISLHKKEFEYSSGGGIKKFNSWYCPICKFNKRIR